MSYNTFVGHVVEGAFDLLLLLYGYFALDMLDRENRRVSPDGVYPRHITYSIEQAGEGLLQGDDVLGCCSGMGCFSDLVFWRFRV